MVEGFIQNVYQNPKTIVFILILKACTQGIVSPPSLYIAQLKADEAIVQVGFSENYTCQYQDEIEAAHWSQEQVTLFTVAIWVKNAANNTTYNSHIIVSDELWQKISCCFHGFC